MARIISPPKNDHARLRQPMTKGEQKLFDLLDKLLDPEWEIYIQPHLNGLRPDFVLLNPKIGICIIEVKDWNLEAMQYYVKKHPSNRVELYANNGQRSFAVQNPFEKIKRYKEAIFNIYCPRLQSKAGFAAIVGTVVFPFAKRQAVMKLQAPFLKLDVGMDKAAEYWPVGGQDEFNELGLPVILPILKRERHGLMTASLADDFRGWLVEPDFAQTQRVPLELDRYQLSLANSKKTASGYRRIRGPAGSGKSLVLAARAAKLACEEKDVLIVTYNKTLWHYLRDLIARGAISTGWSKHITFVHFHDWCKDVCIQARFEDDYATMMAPVAKIMDLKLDRKEEAQRLDKILPHILNVALPTLANTAAKSETATKYDAVFVDEGQDFLPLWWNALRNIRKPDGEMMLVADATQDVYGTARNWTDEAMTGAGFPSGPWVQLGRELINGIPKAV